MRISPVNSQWFIAYVNFLHEGSTFFAQSRKEVREKAYHYIDEQYAQAAKQHAA